MTQPTDADNLRIIAARVDAAPSVARRSGGVLGSAAAYLPGERIEGLKIRDAQRLEVHVVMRWGTTADDVEREVLAAVGDRWDVGPVDIVVDDIALPDEPTQAAVASGPSTMVAELRPL
jgi:hypothetical protein